MTEPEFYSGIVLLYGRDSSKLHVGSLDLTITESEVRNFLKRDRQMVDAVLTNFIRSKLEDSWVISDVAHFIFWLGAMLDFNF
jgi:hypothetical protein